MERKVEEVVGRGREVGSKGEKKSSLRPPLVPRNPRPPSGCSATPPAEMVRARPYQCPGPIGRAPRAREGSC